MLSAFRAKYFAIAGARIKEVSGPDKFVSSKERLALEFDRFARGQCRVARADYASSANRPVIMAVIVVNPSHAKYGTVGIIDPVASLTFNGELQAYPSYDALEKGVAESNDTFVVIFLDGDESPVLSSDLRIVYDLWQGSPEIESYKALPVWRHDMARPGLGRTVSSDKSAVATSPVAASDDEVDAKKKQQQAEQRRKASEERIMDRIVSDTSRESSRGLEAQDRRTRKMLKLKAQGVKPVIKKEILGSVKPKAVGKLSGSKGLNIAILAKLKMRKRVKKGNP